MNYEEEPDRRRREKTSTWDSIKATPLWLKIVVVLGVLIVLGGLIPEREPTCADYRQDLMQAKRDRLTVDGEGFDDSPQKRRAVAAAAYRARQAGCNVDDLISSEVGQFGPSAP